MYKVKIFFIIQFVSLCVFTQEDNTVLNDTIKSYKLDEVTVVGTGQHNPQSIKKAVYDVTVIKNKKIKQLAATSIEDVLRQSLNLTITPDPSSGKTNISLFGLDGEYVKILVDNIPLANDSSYGNNSDLSQINLQDVQQIEILEGAMAVEYGANAVAGVVNIVTRKKSHKKISASVSVLEETVGKEFELFNKGKHIQSVNIMSNVTDDIFTSFSFNRNDFGGFYNGRQGRLYQGKEDLRGHQWLPRVQNNTSLLVGFNPETWRIFYKFSYMKDEIDDVNKVFKTNYIPALNLMKPYANDKQYTTQRFYHNLSINKTFSENSRLVFNVLLQIQEREENEFTFYLKSQNTKDEKSNIASKMRVLTSLGSYSFETAKIKSRIGYDIGLKNALLSDLSYNNAEKSRVSKDLNHYDFYGFSEYALSSNFSVRGGVRGMFSQLFPTKLAYNISSKFVSNNWQYRFVFGSAPRNPNLNELYYSFVDVNHNVVGNQLLKSENALSLNSNIKKTFVFNENTSNRIKLTAQLMDVDDRITWVTIVEKGKRNVFTPVNIDRYKSWSISLNDKINYKNLEFSIGAIYLGTSQSLKSKNWDDSYLYNLQLNSSLVYRLPKHGLTFSSYYKYNGEQSMFVADREGTLSIGKQSPYHWLDVSVTKSFMKNKLQLIMGVRNLTNTTQITSRLVSNTGGHSSASSTREFGYGRSYFSKLTFNIF